MGTPHSSGWMTSRVRLSRFTASAVSPSKNAVPPNLQRSMDAMEISLPSVVSIPEEPDTPSSDGEVSDDDDRSEEWSALKESMKSQRDQIKRLRTKIDPNSEESAGETAPTSPGKFENEFGEEADEIENEIDEQAAKWPLSVSRSTVSLKHPLRRVRGRAPTDAFGQFFVGKTQIGPSRTSFESILKHKLILNPAVQKEMQALWTEALLNSLDPRALSSNGTRGITEEDYAVMYRSLYRQLLPDWPTEPIHELIEEAIHSDWLLETGHPAGRMQYARFFLSSFELAVVWSRSYHPSHVIRFLRQWMLSMRKEGKQPHALVAFRSHEVFQLFQDGNDGGDTKASTAIASSRGSERGGGGGVHRVQIRPPSVQGTPTPLGMLNSYRSASAMGNSASMKPYPPLSHAHAHAQSQSLASSRSLLSQPQPKKAAKKAPNVYYASLALPQYPGSAVMQTTRNYHPMGLVDPVRGESGKKTRNSARMSKSKGKSKSKIKGKVEQPPVVPPLPLSQVTSQTQVPEHRRNGEDTFPSLSYRGETAMRDSHDSLVLEKVVARRAQMGFLECNVPQAAVSLLNGLEKGQIPSRVVEERFPSSLQTASLKQALSLRMRQNSGSMTWRT